MTMTATTPRLIDIGVNLGHRSFASDLPDVLRRAVAAGVDRMVVTGTSVEGSRRARTLAQAHPDVLWSTAGVHPHDAKHWTADSAAELQALAGEPQVVAIGECGLDFDRDFSPRADQERCFVAQLELAAKLQLPVFLHERAAHDRFAAILTEHRPHLPAAVVHCFTSTRAELARYLALDVHIGITGWICDERRGRDLQASVVDVPSDRLMIETDAPFLTPRTIRPKPPRRNEPSLLRHVLHAVADCRGVDPSALGAEVTATTEAFFRLPAR